MAERPEIQAELEKVREERDRALRSRDFTQQWYAERIRRITDTAKREGIWEEIACILANGTASPDEPPTYAQQLNVAKYRAEALRDQLDEASSRAPELEDLASLLESDASAEATYNVAQDLKALADVLGALPQRAIGQHDEIQALHDRAEAAEQQLADLTSKLQSGYSFCHPEDDCEGLRAAMREAGRLQEVRAELEREAAECAENCDAAGQAGDAEAESYYRGLSQGLRNVLALLATPGDEPEGLAIIEETTEQLAADAAEQGMPGEMARQPAPGASEWPEVWLSRATPEADPESFEVWQRDNPPTEYEGETRRYVPAPEGEER